MRKSLLFLAVPLLALSFGHAVAQEEHGPPKVLFLVREDIKPGMMASHNRHAAAYVSVFSRLQTPNYRIAMVPIAGSENEVVYLTGANTFADLEKVLNETDKKMASVNASVRSEIDRLDKEAGSLHSGMRDIIAVFRPDLSFNPGTSIPHMRYFSVTTIRVRPGSEAKYLEYANSFLSVARTKAKLPDTLHIAVYQLASGGPTPTFLVFRPMKSLGEFDIPVGRSIREAMSEDMRKDADKAYSDSVMSTETITYAFAPKLSFMPKEFTSMDAAFWTPQSQATTTPKPKKRASVAAAKQ